ncbi:sensor histidine kinase [Vitiosangium sp. GDMCC 1.1324]|uniref:sensor histidine kinase n=1 Tax=Vitiosangium sp. (strain GDMCC 1.1324) TaxID=2138576 RepID=UPI000D36A798|nr:sensor histidine kinase [Vitiosangium sp. GDMCC 1.1324]PTL79279.1 hypothetical protein DAT35_34295 [Vitiosangium sp. GDMCC 1.1324]
MDSGRKDPGRDDSGGLLTWSALIIALLFGVTMFFVPYEFERDLYTRLFFYLPGLGLLLFLSGLFLLLPRLLSAPPWLDWGARFLFMVSFGWVWVAYALAERIPTAILSFGLLTFLVPLEPLLLRRGWPPFRLYLATLELLFGLTMLLWPSSFTPVVYALQPQGLQWVGTGMVLAGMALATTLWLSPAAPWRTAAELCAGAALLLFAALLASNHRWLGAEAYGVLGFFGLLLPALPRLRLQIRTRLAHRLLRASTLAVLLPLLVLGGVTNAMMQHALRKQVFLGNEALARGSAALVRQYVQDGQGAALMAARQLALVNDVTAWNLPLLEAQLRTLYEESGLYRGIWLLDVSGIVRATYPPSPALLGRNLGDLQCFSEAVHYRRPTLGRVIPSELPGRPLVAPYAVPIEDEAHRLPGVMVAVIDLRGLSEQLNAIGMGQGGGIYLVDENGHIIGHPDPSRLGLPMGEDDVAARRALMGHSGVMEQDERRRIVAFEYVPDLGWALVAELPIQEAYRSLSTMTMVFLLLLTGVALATITLANIVSFRITNPLLTLQETAQAFSMGDLGRRITLTTGDELENLAQAFNRMAGELERLVERLTASEQSLLHTNSELRAVLESVNSAVLVFDQGRKIRYFNRRIQSVLGLEPSGVLGQSIDQVTMALARRAADPESFLVRLTRLAQQPEERSQAEMVLKDPWGVLVHFSSPVFLEGKVLGRIDVYDDISQMRELERLKSEFLLLVSHEFRTPLTFALINTEMALRLLRSRRDVPPEIIRRLEQTRQGERRLVSMIEELLDVASIDAGQMKLHPEPLSLPELVHEVLQRLEPKLRAHPLVVELAANIPQVIADRRRIAQVITNFLTNAAQYTPTGTEILVRLERSGDEVLFSVADRGSGLTSHERSHLFDRFHRAQTLVGQAKEGLGLGLFINKSFIEAHQGRLWVETVHGQGSTFSFSLPVAAPPHA